MNKEYDSAHKRKNSDASWFLRYSLMNRVVKCIGKHEEIFLIATHLFLLRDKRKKLVKNYFGKYPFSRYCVIALRASASARSLSGWPACPFTQCHLTV